MVRDTGRQRAIARRRQSVAALFESGLTSAPAIAKKLGVSASTVARDLKVLAEEWQREARDSYAKTKEDVLVELEKTGREMLESWERSKRPWLEVQAELEKYVDEGDEEMAVTALTRLMKMRPGDPRYIQVFHDSLEKQIKMLGFYNVEQVDQTQTVRFDFRDCSTEELLMLRNFAEAQQTQQAQQGAPARAVEEDIEEGEEQTIGGDRT